MKSVNVKNVNLQLLNSEKGLKTHMKRKHPVETKETISFHCELCDYETSKKIELKRHTHTLLKIMHANVMNVTLQEKMHGHCKYTIERFTTNTLNADFVTFLPKNLETLNLHFINLQNKIY